MTANNQLFDQYAQRWQAAGHGQKKSIVEEVEQVLGLNRHAFYRRLKAAGYNTGRKTRADKGRTEQDEQSLEMLEAMLVTGARANGKQIMETPNAISVLSQNGHKFKSKSTVNRLLRQRNATAKQLTRDTANVRLRSLYPNHVHQVDPSLCIIYYPPGKKGVVQHFMNDDDFYKNKPANFEKVKNLRVWRYVLTDHASGTSRYFYYQSAGESSAILFQFLLWAWGEHNDSKCPMRGVPDILVMDQGSANTSKAILRAIDALGVRVIVHKTKNSRAKGQVEGANNLAETLFESRLIYEPVSSVEELNQRAVEFQNAFNSNTIPEYDARHSRTKKARYEVWMRALALGKVRDLPPPNVCRWLLTNDSKPRKVRSDLTISFRHPQLKTKCNYDLNRLVGISVGIYVDVLPLIIGKPGAILVNTTLNDEKLTHQVLPIITDEYGFDINGYVIGDLDAIKQPADTAVDERRKNADKLAYPGMTEDQIKKAKQSRKTAPFEGKLDALSHIANVETPDYLQVRGEQITTEFDQVETTERTLSGLKLKAAIRERMPRALTDAENKTLSNMGDVAESQLDDIAAQFNNPTPNKPTLKVVGG